MVTASPIVIYSWSIILFALLGNRYWIELRATHRDDDLVADLHGTVIKLKELFEPAWPGTKIR